MLPRSDLEEGEISAVTREVRQGWRGDVAAHQKQKTFFCSRTVGFAQIQGDQGRDKECPTAWSFHAAGFLPKPA